MVQYRLHLQPVGHMEIMWKECSLLNMQKVAYRGP